MGPLDKASCDSKTVIANLWAYMVTLTYFSLSSDFDINPDIQNYAYNIKSLNNFQMHCHQI